MTCREDKACSLNVLLRLKSSQGRTVFLLWTRWLPQSTRFLQEWGLSYLLTGKTTLLGIDHTMVESRTLQSDPQDTESVALILEDRTVQADTNPRWFHLQDEQKLLRPHNRSPRRI